MTKPVINKFRFDYQNSFTMATPRALCAVLSISFNAGDPKDAQNANACHDELLKVWRRNGYLPYRAGNLMMANLDEGSDVFFDVLKTIKNALDPCRILAPGRYDPWGARNASTG